MIFEIIVIIVGAIIGTYWYMFHLKLFWQSVQAFKMMSEMPPLGKPPKALEDAIKASLGKLKENDKFREFSEVVNFSLDALKRGLDKFRKS